VSGQHPLVAQERWAARLRRVEHAVEARVAARLRNRPGWLVTVDPYVGHGTPTRVHLRGRAVVRRERPRRGTGRTGALVTGLARYARVEATGEPVDIEVAGTTVPAVSDEEGYVDVDVDLPGVSPGWHDVTWRPSSGPVPGRLFVVDPEAPLGLVSDLDDTVIHTGLTRAWEALRSTLLVADDARVPIAGGAELYQELLAVPGRASPAGRADGSQDPGPVTSTAPAPAFYVSTGAWNLHEMLLRFLARHGFPAGPLLLTDWGPSARWLFREDSTVFKTRTIVTVLDEHPGLDWVLVGDSGQHDPEAYAAVVRSRPGRVRAVYIRAVPPTSLLHPGRLDALAAEMAGLGVPLLLIRDSVEAAEHARGLGLIGEPGLARVRAAVRG